MPDANYSHTQLTICQLNFTYAFFITLIPAIPDTHVAKARIKSKIQLPEHELASDGLLLIPMASDSKRRFKGTKNKASRQLSKPNNFIMKSNLA